MLKLTKTEQLESMIRGAGFVGKKFDAVWPTALKLRDSGLSNASILRHIIEDFSYLL